MSSTSEEHGEVRADTTPSMGAVREPRLEPVLIFGIVRAIGTDLSAARQELESALQGIDYHVEQVKLSQLFSQIVGFADTSGVSELSRYEAQMDQGDWIREASGSGAGVAYLGIKKISELRNTGASGRRGRAFILESLMHEREIKLLREVYGSQFFVISCFSSRLKRLIALTDKLADTSGKRRDHMEVEALKLLNRDAGLELADTKGSSVAKDFRLNIGDAFYQADLFVNVEEPEATRQHIQRLVGQIVSWPHGTPTPDEYGMSLAYIASLNTASLSRRVGAAILRRENVLATGTNEVPQFGGGLYMSDSKPDQRDYQIGYDPSDRSRRHMLSDILRRLAESKWLTEDKVKLPISELTKAAMTHDILRKSELLEVIEYTRTIHAEMAALMSALTQSVNVVGRRSLPRPFHARLAHDTS